MSSQPRKDNPRSRRAARACTRCHSRKVRCDGSITGFPCTNCRLDARPCTLHSGKRDKEKQLFRAIAKEREHAYPTPAPDQDNLTFVKAQTALKVPIQEVLDVFVNHYFLYVHPFLPVVDEAVFWRKYRSLDASAGKISTLLFQTMLFAASPFVPIEAAKECGYDSLISARDDLYRRAKRLYESGVEKDRLVISQACLLLTWYSTDAERSTNSKWLRIAIRYAKREQAHLYHQMPQLGSGRKVSDLKRLWWCCMIRDRIISLGMRRPIQITPDEFDLQLQEGLSFQDLEEECLSSEVYNPDAKIALCRVLASLCHLVVAVTDLIMLVYPTTQNMPLSLADRRAQLNRLEETKFGLLEWEISWVANPDGKEYYIHPSLTLYTNLCAIYFQSARIALCNRICLLIGHNAYLTDETDMSRIESCRVDLATAIRSTAHNVKQLILNGVADKLPISAVAYTLFPQILLSIQTQLTPSPEDKELHELMLVFFTEAFRFFRSQYYTRLILAVSWKALELCRPAIKTPLLQSSSSSIASAGDIATTSDKNGGESNGLILNASLIESPSNALSYYPDLFQLKLTEYIRLLRYVDEFMSLRSSPGENAIYPTPAIQSQSQQRHARTYSQTSICSMSSLPPPQAVPVTYTDIAAANTPRDTNMVYTGDNATEDPTSPKWTEDYFWVYFGETELEGDSPQTTTTADADTGTPSSSSNFGCGSSRLGLGVDHRTGSKLAGSPQSQTSGTARVSDSPEATSKGKENHEEIGRTCREAAAMSGPADLASTAVQNMLACLPLLGE
ncbi:putative Zn(II)2Cys6 transcription factor [Aspergillus mulundensis]|uniref:Putative Zn(II)2Cys6 transcription factor n=1 Tax=Aspergillus mulundensis TaxID=1810919 RepID=A0A3D8SVZ1_9EURO|nr:putative Zn(II)2Cys6 transcription factor [Aspergillus mulundensis]RDW90444.1 putative Zn(II)2Cys6 transcription factor [Aspergillus mulundensis]